MPNICDTILHPIIKSIRENPTHSAFKIEGQPYSYQFLGKRVSAIRRLIRQSNIAEKIVAICIHNDVDTYATIVALWMEGKGYVPLHPNQPIERNLNIISQVGIPHIIDSQNSSCILEWGKEDLAIHTENAPDGESFLSEWTEADEDDVAYILFTSGSTGTPKGVTISRRNVSAFMDSFWKTGIHLNETDRCLQAFDLTFDVSVQSFLVALTVGACLFTVPYGQVKYLYTASLIQNEKLTFGAMAPSMLTYLQPYFEDLDASSLRACIMTAEACPSGLMEKWMKCAKNSEIYNFYGPTEGTVYCTYYKLNRTGKNTSENGIISIGKPLANVHALILDENGETVTGDERGELCIAGPQVTTGYWGQDEKNKKAFFTVDYNREQTRFYHTGDLCHWASDGNIIYCGRVDSQIKIQGFRVDLGEIEYHARKYYHDEVRVIALPYKNPLSITELALFVESVENEEKNLLDHLRTKMPQYMIPTRIVFVKQFPSNNSDKIDRRKLLKEHNCV